MEQHTALITQLTPLLQAPDFDQSMALLCADLSATERFLLKMELNRLNQPTRQSLDLRRRVKEPCDAVEIGGVTHFLPRSKAQHLRQSVKLYGDRLTIGAIEACLSHVSSPQPIDEVYLPTELPPGQCELLPLGHYVVRQEPRRSFATEISLSQGGEPIDALTLDLSVGGCRVRIDNATRLDPDKPVLIHFIALSKEYIVPALDQGVPYQLLSQQPQKGFLHLRLKRDREQHAQSRELARILQASALRSTLELNHLIATTRSHGYERHLLPNLTTLAIALANDHNHYRPLMLLQTQANQASWHYWLNEQGVNQLSAALSNSRISRLLQEPDNGAHALLYSFHIRQREQLLFFTATLSELMHNGHADSFLHLAAQQDSFRVHQLSFQQLSPTDIRRALRNPINSQAFEPLVCQQLQEANLLLQLQPLPGAQGAHYQHRTLNIDPDQLRRYGMSRVNKDPIRPLLLKFDDRRRESRFQLNTPCILSQGRKHFAGNTLDVSPRGLKLQLDAPGTFAKGDTLVLALPKMQPLAGKLKLSGMHYQIVGLHADNRTLRLKATHSHSHAGVVFLSHLLNKNHNKLTELGSSHHHLQLTEGMKNFALRQLQALPLFVHKRHRRLQFTLIGASAEPSPLHRRLMSEASEHADLSWLLLQPQIKALLEQLSEARPNEPVVLELAAILPTETESARCLYLPHQPAQLRQFIVDGLVRQRFIGLRLELVPTGKPDLDYLQQDLAAISGHALHRARELEEMLWQVQGCGQLYDISHELMCRAGLESLLPTPLVSGAID
ncbi:PilZ domain-containing protein [Ferrimonas pelagia]|uniref:PilZ domain-containing protein n=1 Tax=Ferrimonas pelagia TaxID=1177826 RepID=A0ABP9EF29_9GAMM